VTARWPRLMKRKTAAEYCDMTESAFEREVMTGRLPAGVSVGGRDHWDRRALDESISRLSGGETIPDYRRELQARYAQA